MISVIIPSFNRARTIERSIRSVLAQTYHDLEIIIVDDGSSDNTEEVIRRIGDERIRYYRLEMNQGACSARNKGIDLARGEYIAFQDSDDEWLPEKLMTQFAALVDNHADVCFCTLEKHYVDDVKPPFLFPKFRLEKNRFVSHQEIYSSSKVGTQTILAKKNVCDEIKFDPNVIKGQDYDWAIRASEKYKFYYVNSVLVIQYVQRDSISVGGSKKIVEARTYFLKKYAYKFDEYPDFQLSLLKALAYHKTLIGEDSAAEYKEIYKKEKNVKNLLKYFFAQLGVIKPLYNLRGREESSL